MITLALSGLKNKDFFPQPLFAPPQKSNILLGKGGTGDKTLLIGLSWRFKDYNKQFRVL